jgi:hypothetical protein
MVAKTAALSIESRLSIRIRFRTISAAWLGLIVEKSDSKGGYFFYQY